MSSMADNPIEKVRNRLSHGEYWQKDELGAFRHSNTKVCLMGAFYSAHGADMVCNRPTKYGVDLVSKVVEEQFPDRIENRLTLPIKLDTFPVWFNDHDQTTWDEVDLVLEKAAGLWDEHHD